MALSLPYIIVVAVMSLLLSEYFKAYNGDMNIKKLFSGGIDRINGRYIFVVLAYLIYVVFAVSKKIEMGLGSTDAYYYMNYYSQIPPDYFYYIKHVTTFEIGYSTVTWIFRQLTENYRVMLFFWSTLSYFLAVKFLRHVNLKNDSYLPVFVVMLTLISQFNTLRMSVSIMIGLWSFIYLYEEKWAASLIVAFLSMSIQVSNVILIPVWLVYFIVIKRKTRPILKTCAWCAIGGVFAAVAFRYAAGFIAAGAKGLYLGASGLSLGTYLAVILIFTLSAVKYRQMVELWGFNRLLILILPVCLICIPLQMQASIMYRMTLMFVPVMMALIPSLCTCYADKCSRSAVGIIVKLSMYGYMMIRIVSFFTEEIIYIGPYISVLLS